MTTKERTKRLATTLTNNNIMHVWHVNARGRSSVKLLHGVIDVGDIAFICPTYSAHESTSGWFGSAPTTYCTTALAG